MTSPPKDPILVAHYLFPNGTIIVGNNGSDFQIIHLTNMAVLESKDGIDTVDFTGMDLAIAVITAHIVTGVKISTQHLFVPNDRNVKMAQSAFTSRCF